MIKPHLPTLSGYRITSPYGSRIHPITGKLKLHTGTDFAPNRPGQTGVPIFAVADGIVKRARYHTTMGNYIYLKHESDDHTSVYMHMAHLDVKENSRVRRGQLLGMMGTTGLSTGIHLHFMISTSYPPSHKGFNLIDPLDYLKRGEKMEVKEDGILGKNTILRLQEFFGTPQDGKITKEKSTVIMALQKFLNSYGQ